MGSSSWYLQGGGILRLCVLAYYVAMRALSTAALVACLSTVTLQRAFYCVAVAYHAAVAYCTMPCALCTMYFGFV